MERHIRVRVQLHAFPCPMGKYASGPPGRPPEHRFRVGTSRRSSIPLAPKPNVSTRDGRADLDDSQARVIDPSRWNALRLRARSIGLSGGRAGTRAIDSTAAARVVATVREVSGRVSHRPVEPHCAARNKKGAARGGGQLITRHGTVVGRVVPPAARVRTYVPGASCSLAGACRARLVFSAATAVHVPEEIHKYVPVGPAVQ